MSYNVVITGDSLSYNRYDYDTVHRVNAYDCYAGMQSWSFKLRDYLIKRDKNCFEGADIGVEGAECVNPGEVSAHPFSVINRDKCIVIKIDKDTKEARLSLPLQNAGDGVLYMQSVPDFSCAFDAYIGGRQFLKGFCNKGDLDYFQGMALRSAEFKTEENAGKHIVKLDNFSLEREHGYIIISGGGALNTKVYLTGRGSTTAGFLTENYSERIGRYNPDLLIFTSGANDKFQLSPEQYKDALDSLFRQINSDNKNCKIIAISASKIADIDNSNNDLPRLKDQNGEPYHLILKQCCQENNAVFVDASEIFKNLPVKYWRYDNVHFTKAGNDILFKAIVSLL